MMNIFRFFGDMSHLASILILILKLRASKSAAGEPQTPGDGGEFFCVFFFLWTATGWFRFSAVV